MIAIDLGERCDHARCAAELAEIRGRQQQSQIARSAKLVDLDEPSPHIRAFGQILLLELKDAIARGGELRRHLVRVGAHALEALELDLSFEFEPAEIVQKRSLWRGKLIRLLLQCLESFRCTASQRFGLRSVTLLSNGDGSSGEEQRDY